MSDPLARLRRFLRELKRRNVYKVAVTYAAVVFIGLQAVRLLVPATTLPGWADELLIAIAVLGFPIAIVLAWAFEMTPEGMRRTEAPEGEELGGSGAYQWIGLAAVVLLAGGVWYVTAGGEKQPPAETAATTDTAQAESTVSDRSIAVLPFDNLSGTEEAEPFANGLHDDLLTRLSNISELKVISRTSVLPYRETELSLPAIADSLGVSWIVEGGVQQAGDQVQVNAQLIQAEEDAHQWAETYRRELTMENLFAVQSDLTKKIAQSLQAELTPEETDRIERRPTEDLEAYRLYVRGRQLLARRTAATIDSARGYFERALRNDSTYALAWVGLADTEALYAAYRTPDRSYSHFVEAMKTALPKAEAAADRALKIAPDLAEAHASRGLIYLYQHDAGIDRQNGPVALRELQRAVTLKPSYAQAHHWLGSLQLDLGQPELARNHLHLAVRLNPEHFSARIALLQALLATREYQEAGRELGSLEARYPDRTGRFFREWKSTVLVHLKRWDAVREILRPYASGSDTPPVWAPRHLALADLARGDTASAHRRLERLRRRADESPSAMFEVALVEAALDNEDAAFSALRETDWSPFAIRLALRYFYPDVLDPLREDSRYRELIGKLNRQYGLNPDGSLPDSVDVSFDTQTHE